MNTRKRWRIAFVITRANDVGGAQVHVRDLSTYLKTTGAQVLVISGPSGRLTEELADRGIENVCIDELQRRINPWRDTVALIKMRRVLREFSPDIVSTHSSKASVLGRIAASSLGVPTLFTAHGWSFAPGKPKVSRIVYRTIERLVAPLATKIVAVSTFDYELALQASITSSDHLRVIRNGMPDVDSAFLAEPQRSPPKIVVVARFSPQKDHETLVRAMTRLHDFDWNLELIGDGRMQRTVEELVHEVGLDSRVSFLGHRRDVSRRLASAQMFVLPSKWEGLPRSIIEAMRGGLPVVASDVGGVDELVADGVSGYLVPKGDVEEMAAKLRALIESPNLRRQMGKQGRRIYEERFRFERVIEEHLQLYSKIIGES